MQENGENGSSSHGLTGKPSNNPGGRPKDTEWEEEYFAQMEQRDAPYTIIHELGRAYSLVLKRRKEDPEFARREQEAVARYHEKLYEELREFVEEYPALRFKFAEKVVEKLKVPQAKVDVNIDASQNLTLVGLDQKQCYEDTQKLIERFTDRNKQLTGSNGVNGGTS